ncbi:MAG: hypothetical protein JSS87_07525 [Acidobacteria bacterium]|nr:hypothetical protein [Acidobacteriota bacterium]
MNCHNVEEGMMDLLEAGDLASLGAGPMAEHIAGCPGCSARLMQMRSLFAAMDDWKAPEVSPWFDSKMHARLREEAQRAPEGFFERMRSRFLFNSAYTMKPLVAGAMALVLVAGGGTVAYEQLHHTATTPSVAVQDLQRFENNMTALQDMDQLDQAVDNASDDAVPAS